VKGRIFKASFIDGAKSYIYRKRRATSTVNEAVFSPHL
jgi:hypothetical protein